MTASAANDDAILKQLALVLRGAAYRWWQRVRRSISTWEIFKIEFLQNFLPVDYELRLEDKLRERVQYDDKPFSDYVDAMETIYSRLKRSVTDQEKAQMVIRNVHPCYKTFFRGQCVTMHDVITRGREAEKETAEITRHRMLQDLHPRQGRPFPRPRVTFADERPFSRDRLQSNYYHGNQRDTFQNRRSMAPSHMPNFRRDVQDPRPNFQRTVPDPRPNFQRNVQDTRPNFRRNVSDTSQNFQRNIPDARTSSTPPSRNMSSQNEVRCFGCGARGVYRRDCQRCNSGDNRSLFNSDNTGRSDRRTVMPLLHPTPYFSSINVGDKTIQAVFDSGAFCSMIDETFLSSLDAAIPVHHVAMTCTPMQQADKSVITPKSWVTIPITINDHTTTGTFAVMDPLAHTIVLGNDFLKKAHLCIDFSTGAITTNLASVLSAENANTSPKQTNPYIGLLMPLALPLPVTEPFDKKLISTTQDESLITDVTLPLYAVDIDVNIPDDGIPDMILFDIELLPTMPTIQNTNATSSASLLDASSQFDTTPVLLPSTMKHRMHCRPTQLIDIDDFESPQQTLHAVPVVNIMDNDLQDEQMMPVLSPILLTMSFTPYIDPMVNFGQDETSQQSFIKNTCVSAYVPSSVLLTDLPHAQDSLSFHSLTPMENLDVHADNDNSASVREQLIEEYPHLFSGQPGRCTTMEHKIVTTSEQTFYQAPYRYSPGKRTIIEQEIQTLLKCGIIEPSSSPWSSPIVLVTSTGKKPRLCVDFRKLNSITVHDAYPMPRVDDLLDTLGKAKIFSTLDLQKGFWQIPMSPTDKEKTAFATSRGLYHFKYMPFGLKNASATFQRTMNFVLAGFIGSICIVYIDDIIVFSSSYEEHIEHLRQILERLDTFGLTLHLEKCHFLKESVTFLGHEIDASGIRPSTLKVDAIVNFPTPTSLKNVQSFLGMINYFRCFIPKCSEVSAPLRKLMKNGMKFKWQHDQEQAFQTLKMHLANPPILKYPDFEKPFRLSTDASTTGLGALIEQEHDGKFHPVAYASRSLSDCEVNYSATELECLAIVWTVNYFRPYLEDMEFTIRTDHKALQWLFNVKNPNSRLTRWALQLQEFTFKITHVPGKQNFVADALSRVNEKEKFKDTDTVSKQRTETPLDETVTTINVVTAVNLREALSDKDKIRAMQRSEANWTALIHFLSTGVLPADEKLKIWTEKNSTHFELYAGLLYKRGEQFDTREGTRCRPKPTLVIPTSMIQETIQAYHSSPNTGHMGGWKTLQRLRQHFFWPKMKKDVYTFVKNCGDCQKFKSPRSLPVGKLMHLSQTEPWHTVAVDLMGPFPRSRKRNTFLLVVLDTCTKWIELFALRKATTKEVVKKLTEEVFSRFGLPVEIISDNGPQFVSSLYDEMCTTFGIKPKRTTPYHPQANPTERVNQSIGTLIAMSVGDNHATWDENLAHIALALRTATSESTRETPSFLNFGRDIRLPQDLIWSVPLVHNVDATDDSSSHDVTTHPTFVSQFKNNLRHAFKSVQEHLQDSLDKSKTYYDSRRKDDDFNIGDRVWRRSHPRSNAINNWMAKLAPKWSGPYIITEKYSPIAFKIQHENGNSCTCNIVDMKRFHTASLGTTDPPAEQHTQDAHETSGTPNTTAGQEITSDVPAWSLLPPDLPISEHEMPCASPMCKKPDDDLLQWIQCDGPCDLWYHFACVDVPESATDDEFVCVQCRQNTDEEPIIEFQSSDTTDHQQPSEEPQRKEGLRPRHVLRTPSRYEA